MQVNLSFGHRKTLEEAVNDFLNAKKLSLSESCWNSYALCFKRAQGFLGKDKPMLEINAKDIQNFLCTVPGGGKNHRNAYVSLSSLWSYCQAEGFTKIHVVHHVDKPRFTKRIIPRFTLEECQRLLHACEWSNESHCANRKAFTQKRIENKRSLAIILTLLDTGIRASELCGLKNGDIGSEYIKVLGKGDKEREIPLSERTREVIKQYVASRKFTSNMVFTSEDGNPMDRFCLSNMIDRIGITAQVPDTHAHRFRHTFAINFLRNGGDPYALKAILGHTTLEMVERYLDMTREDLLLQHQKASPVINWGL
ncbi:MAG: site-specific integrase [Anaerolineaceae bacterium]|nr:site-specific integrase [Anaerolineaceae bacterium]